MNLRAYPKGVTYRVRITRTGITLRRGTRIRKAPFWKRFPEMYLTRNKITLLQAVERYMLERFGDKPGSYLVGYIYKEDRRVKDDCEKSYEDSNRVRTGSKAEDRV